MCVVLLTVSLSFSNNYSNFIENSNLVNDAEDIFVLIVLDERISKQNIEFTDDSEYNQNVIMNMIYIWKR